MVKSESRRFEPSNGDGPDFLKGIAKHSITITGGMNLARAAWNNPALNALVMMHNRLCDDKGGDHEKLGLIYGNGGLSYRQGIAIVERVIPNRLIQ
jgi:hypothetical protein